MTLDDVISRLKAAPNQMAIARATGLPYHYLRHLIDGDITDPGASKIDRLRSYFLTVDIAKGRPQ